MVSYSSRSWQTQWLTMPSHRDLKPENLLLDKNKQIKVADFGMAALEPSGQMLQTSCGSPHYASPEIVAGKTYHGAPSDIWSCGITLFALLTGYLPFDDENIRELLRKVRTGFFNMPADLSRDAKDLLWRMLEIDPRKRIKMEEILVHPLILKYKRAKGPKLPRAPTHQELVRPVNSFQDIDREILRNLQTLWRGAPKEVIIQKLLAHEHNSEKTFYLLLMKYRHDRLENYTGSDDEARPMIKSASRRSIKSMHSRKSASSRRGHHKSSSRSSKLSATSSHRRGVSFGASKKKNRELTPALPSGSSAAALAPPLVHRSTPLEREVINYALPRRDSPSKRLPPVSPVKQPFDDESTRKMSAEFSQFLDLAFNTSSTTPTTVLDDPETYQARPLPHIPFGPNVVSIQRPSSTEPAVSSKVDQKQRAHKSVEAAAPLPRIFEEDRDRYADAEEQHQRALAAAAKENAARQDRPKPTEGYSYPARTRAALGELDPNNVQEQQTSVSASTAAAAAMRHFPAKRTVDGQQRISSMVEQESAKSESAGRRFFSAPIQRIPSAEQPVVKRNWYGKKIISTRQETQQAQTLAPALSSVQQSPPGHSAHTPVNLAARRTAPAPPRLNIPKSRQSEESSPPFPHPSTFNPSPVAVKQSFFARMLGVKPVCRIVHTSYSPIKLQSEIAETLARWERNDLGAKLLEDNRHARIIRARLARRNALGLKPVRFRIELRDTENVGSQAVFHLEKGSNSSHNRVVDQYEDILRAQHVLIERRNPSRLSAYAV